jgi:uncharacterized protein YqjF (DUF2071 family)
VAGKDCTADLNGDYARAREVVPACLDFVLVRRNTFYGDLQLVLDGAGDVSKVSAVTLSRRFSAFCAAHAAATWQNATTGTFKPFYRLAC